MIKKIIIMFLYVYNHGIDEAKAEIVQPLPVVKDTCPY